MDNEEYQAELKDADIALNDAHDFLDTARVIAGDNGKNNLAVVLSQFQDEIRNIIDWIENQ